MTWFGKKGVNSWMWIEWDCSHQPYESPFSSMNWHSQCCTFKDQFECQFKIELSGMCECWFHSELGTSLPTARQFDKKVTTFHHFVQFEFNILWSLLSLHTTKTKIFFSLNHAIHGYFFQFNFDIALDIQWLVLKFTITTMLVSLNKKVYLP